MKKIGIDVCGINPAPVTPFTRDGAVDYAAIKRIGSWLGSIDGVKSFTVLGHAGEGTFCDRDEQAIQVMTDKFTPASKIYQSKLEELLQNERDQVNAFAREIDNNYGASRNLLIALGVVALVFSIFLAWSLSSSITRPLTQSAGNQCLHGEMTLACKTVMQLTKEIAHSGMAEPAVNEEDPANLA